MWKEKKRGREGVGGGKRRRCSAAALASSLLGCCRSRVAVVVAVVAPSVGAPSVGTLSVGALNVRTLGCRRVGGRQGPINVPKSEAVIAQRAHHPTGAYDVVVALNQNVRRRVRVHRGQPRLGHYQRGPPPHDMVEIVPAVRPIVAVSVQDELMIAEVITRQGLVRRVENVVRLNSLGLNNWRGHSTPRSRPLPLASSRLACRLAHQLEEKEKRRRAKEGGQAAE